MAAAFPILFVQGQGYTYEWTNVLVKSFPSMPILNSISENGTIDDERRHDDFENQLSDDSDIQMVDR